MCNDPIHWKWGKKKKEKKKHDSDVNENNMFFVLCKTSDERPLMKTCLHRIKDLQEGALGSGLEQMWATVF